MSKKHDFHLHYTRIVNGAEFPDHYIIRNVRSKQAAEDKLKDLCRKAGGPEPVITSNIEL